MLLIPTTSLQAGMVLAHPVYHPASTDLILLAKGYVLNDEMIARLQDFALTHVWVEFPGLEEVDRKTNERINRGHMALFQALNSSVDKMEKRVAVKVNLRQYKRTVRQMLMEIVTDPDHEVITNQLTGCAPVLSGHLANCCYLSLLIGAHMSGYLRHERSTLPPEVAANTAHLGLGALLHDVGKLNMTDDMQTIGIIDEEADWPEYRMHVQAGYEDVRETVPVVASNIVLNHHQKYDGTGFPVRQSHKTDQPAAPLEGNGIHIFSRIVAVVDAFDHLLCPNGEIVPTIQAIHAIKSEQFAGWFDPIVVETLLRLIPPFMVGSVVTLSDGTNAVVVSNHPEAPCRPSVKLLSGPLCDKNTRIRGRQLDLRMCRELIIAAVDGFDVRPYLYNGELEPLQEHEADMITISPVMK